MTAFAYPHDGPPARPPPLSRANFHATVERLAKNFEGKSPVGGIEEGEQPTTTEALVQVGWLYEHHLPGRRPFLRRLGDEWDDGGEPVYVIRPPSPAVTRRTPSPAVTRRNGHAIRWAVAGTSGKRDYYCECGLPLGTSRAMARDTMRFHRHDLWMADR